MPLEGREGERHADDLRCSRVVEGLKRTSDALDVLEHRARRNARPRAPVHQKLAPRLSACPLLRTPQDVLSNFSRFGENRLDKLFAEWW
jgi:hypothetical protein